MEIGKMDIFMIYCALQDAKGLEKMLNSDDYSLKIIKETARVHVEELEHIYNNIKKDLK